MGEGLGVRALESAIGNRQSAILRVGILTVSDRSARGERPDLSGPALVQAVTERLTDQLDQHVSGWLGAKGCQTTGRFSPGYCDWDLSEGQEALFRFLAPESVGVRRTSAGMMIPQKSISAALVGAREVSLRYPCPFCAKGDCPYRRADPELRDQGPGAGGQDFTPNS